jgi:hypothetical protein
VEKTERNVQTRDVPVAKDSRNFEVQCSAGKSGSLHVSAESLSVQVGQRVLREGAKEIWHSVNIFANEDQSGSLVIRVLVSNPDWEEPIQIASITSRPHDANCRTILGCNLNHVPA